MDKSIKVIELFAGVGGFRLGLEGWNGKSASSGYKKELNHLNKLYGAINWNHRLKHNTLHWFIKIVLGKKDIRAKIFCKSSFIENEFKFSKYNWKQNKLLTNQNLFCLLSHFIHIGFSSNICL